MKSNKLTNRLKVQFDPIERQKANRKRQWTLFATGLILMLMLVLIAGIVSLSVLHLYPAFRSFIV